jgi:hypothetical protein
MLISIGEKVYVMECQIESEKKMYTWYLFCIMKELF